MCDVKILSTPSLDTSHIVTMITDNLVGWYEPSHNHIIIHTN